jgi:hypothetical protein
VRKKGRGELHIEHREVSIFAGGPAVSRQAIDFRQSDATRFLQVRQTACPTCGSPELQMLTDAVTNFRLDLAALNKGIQDGSVHFHRSPSGEWWICTKSLHQC